MRCKLILLALITILGGTELTKSSKQPFPRCRLQHSFARTQRNWALRAFPGGTLSLDFSFTTYNLVCVGCKIQSIRNGVLFGQQAQTEGTSHPRNHLIIPNHARAMLIWTGWSLKRVFVVEFITR